MNKTLTCYIWKHDTTHIGIFPSDLGHPLWRSWLERQDATKRRFIENPSPGFWLMDSSFIPKIYHRCIEVGWVVSHKKPSFLLLNGISGTDNIVDPFKVFHLTSTAPKDVVDVVYRHLIKKSHTDTGEGDEELTVMYNNARDDIYSMKGW